MLEVLEVLLLSKVPDFLFLRMPFMWAQSLLVVARLLQVI